MPAYNAQVPRALYPGESISLVDDASVDGSITTSLQFCVGPNPVNTSNVVNFINQTNHDAVGQVCWHDVTGDYTNCSGLTVAAGTALPYNLADSWVRFTFAVAPTTGSFVAAR